MLNLRRNLKLVALEGLEMKKYFFRTIVIILALCAVSGFSHANSDDPAIFWDNEGNVHIFTTSEAELNFAWGWAQMRDNTELLLDTIQNERASTIEQIDASQVENYQLFADGMTGFLNRRLETVSPAHKALLPLQASDIFALQNASLSEWTTVFLHADGFQGAGTSSLGYPNLAVSKQVEAVSREVLMEGFRQLELLLPLN